MRVWGTLESLLERHQGMLSRNDRTMRCARVEFKDGDDVTALIGAALSFCLNGKQHSGLYPDE